MEKNRKEEKGGEKKNQKDVCACVLSFHFEEWILNELEHSVSPWKGYQTWEEKKECMWKINLQKTGGKIKMRLVEKTKPRNFKPIFVFEFFGDYKLLTNFFDYSHRKRDKQTLSGVATL